MRGVLFSRMGSTQHCDVKLQELRYSVVKEPISFNHLRFSCTLVSVQLYAQRVDS